MNDFYTQCFDQNQEIADAIREEALVNNVSFTVEQIREKGAGLHI